MKHQFKLTNNLDTVIDLSVEPEGSILKIPSESSIIVEVSGDTQPTVDIQLNKEGDNLYFSIWPENGMYKVIKMDSDGKSG